MFFSGDEVLYKKQTQIGSHDLYVSWRGHMTTITQCAQRATLSIIEFHFISRNSIIDIIVTGTSQVHNTENV